MRAPVRLNRREVRPGQAARGRWGSRAVAPRLGRPSRRRGRAGQAEGPRGRDNRRGAGAWRGGRRGGGEASSDARWTLGGAVEARPARVELGGAGGVRHGRVGAPVEQELLPRARAELRGGRRTRSSTAGGVRPARAELGGGQGAAKPATAAGSECAGCRGSRRGGEEEDQCMTCGSHQTGANGIRSLLMLILPTKQKMEPLHPSNQT